MEKAPAFSNGKPNAEKSSDNKSKSKELDADLTALQAALVDDTPTNSTWRYDAETVGVIHITTAAARVIRDEGVPTMEYTDGKGKKRLRVRFNRTTNAAAYDAIERWLKAHPEKIARRYNIGEQVEDTAKA